MDAASPSAPAQSKTTDFKENALLKELLLSGSDFKFSLSPSQHKLVNIKLLPAWFDGIVKMLESKNYPDIENFLFMTSASLNEGNKLTLKTTTCKKESGVKLEPASEEQALLIEAIQSELEAFNKPIANFATFAAFLEESHYEREILSDHELKNVVSPTLFPSVQASKLLKSSELFMSPKYQETVTIGDTIGGKTRVSDITEFVLPSSVRINSAKHVTFHYVKGKQLPESRIHQMIRPHLWRWLTIALDGGPFTHLLKESWEGDHTHLFQTLIKIQNEQREETDQVFAIFNCLSQLFKKIAKDSLPTWYIQALKDVEKVNSVTSTYRDACNLMMIPKCMVDSMYMIHAHGMGHDKLMAKISRENEGYVPIKELQRQIALEIDSTNRTQSFNDFTTQNSNLFNKGNTRQQVNNTTGQRPTTTPQATTRTAPATGGGSGVPLKGDERVNVCRNFLDSKCEKGKECKYEHRKIKVPGAACSKFLNDPASCDGSCNKLHAKWSTIINKINAGEISALKGSPPPSASTTPPPANPQGGRGTSGNRGGRGGRRGGKGGNGGRSQGGQEPTTTTPPVVTPPASTTNAQTTPRSSMRKVSFGATEGATCNRCKKQGHIEKDCFTNFHADGSRLLSPRPAPVPDEIATKRKARWDAKQPEVKNVVHSVEFTEQLQQYKELMERNAQQTNEDYDAEINMMEGFGVLPLEDFDQTPLDPVTSDCDEDESKHALYYDQISFADAFTTHELAPDEFPATLQEFADSGPTQVSAAGLSVSEVVRLEARICSMYQEQMTTTEQSGKMELLNHTINLYRANHDVEDEVLALEEAYPGVLQDSLGRLYTVRTEQEMLHDNLYPSDPDDNPRDQDDDLPSLVNSSDDENDNDSDSEAAEFEREEPRIYLVNDAGDLTALIEL